MNTTEPKVIDRIARLKAALFYRPREISLERALLYTESHRQTEGEHVQLRRAKAAAHVLRKVAISIRDDELIEVLEEGMDEALDAARSNQAQEEKRG